MALSQQARKLMLYRIKSMVAEFETLGLSIVDQYDTGQLDGRTASTTHDLLLEAMAAIIEVQTAIESGFEPGPESRELDGALLTKDSAEHLRDLKDQRDLHRLHNDAPAAAEPERLPPIRDDELPGWDFVTLDSPNN